MNTLILDSTLPYVKSQYGRSIVRKNDPYVRIGGILMATLHAFRFHKNLKLSPDAFITMIISQVSRIIQLNSEDYRSYLVSHEKGKIEIHLEGSVNSKMFKSFVDYMEPHIVNKPFLSFLQQKFSTTTFDLMSVRYAMMMGSFQSYFTYSVTECGIRAIEVEGLKTDWLMLKDQLQNLAFLHKNSASDKVAVTVKKWIMYLDSCIDRIIEIYDINDKLNSMKLRSSAINWWNDFVNEENRSGGPYISGHMAKLILITSDGNMKPFFENDADNERRCITTSDVPRECVKLPMRINGKDAVYICGNFYKLQDNDETVSVTPAVELCPHDGIEQVLQLSNVKTSIETADYSQYDHRFSTFKRWPLIRPSKEDVCAAGFYYLGVDDNVKCPACSIQIHQWEESDDPFVEHAKHTQFPCMFLIKYRGTNFISLHNVKM